MFKIGDKVKTKDGEVGEILSIHIDNNGIRYTITSREVDLQAKEIINGVKHLGEDEVEASE